MKTHRKEPMVVKVEASKPRNPLHAVLATRRGGSHRKPEKSLRRAEKQRLGRESHGDAQSGSSSRSLFLGGHSDIRAAYCAHTGGATSLAVANMRTLIHKVDPRNARSSNAGCAVRSAKAKASAAVLARTCAMTSAE